MPILPKKTNHFFGGDIRT